MLPIQELLERFKGVTNTEKARKELVITEIEKVLHKKLELVNIAFSKNRIILKVSPILKTEIIFRKKNILEGIQRHKNLAHITEIN